MKIDSLGIPRFSDQDLIDLIYSGNIDKCRDVLCDLSDEVTKFNEEMQKQGQPLLTTYSPCNVEKEEFDQALQHEWFMPDEYKNINLEQYLIDKCQSDHERVRVLEELEEFSNRELSMLLKYLIYLVEYMRSNKIVWGVGRGSSVASFVLYLIGIHKINSIKYNLDWREFLR